MIIGSVAKAQGIKGELKLNLEIEPERICGLRNVEIDGNFYEVEKLENRVNGTFVKLGGIDDRTQAENLRGKMVSVGREQLENLAENEFYFEDLIGASVADESGRIIGKVDDIEQYGAADVIVIKQDGKLYSLPFLDDIFIGFDAEEKKLFVNRDSYNNMKVFD